MDHYEDEDEKALTETKNKISHLTGCLASQFTYLAHKYGIYRVFELAYPDSDEKIYLMVGKHQREDEKERRWNVFYQRKINQEIQLFPIVEASMFIKIAFLKESHIIAQKLLIHAKNFSSFSKKAIERGTDTLLSLQLILNSSLKQEQEQPEKEKES